MEVCYLSFINYYKMQKIYTVVINKDMEIISDINQTIISYHINEASAQAALEKYINCYKTRAIDMLDINSPERARIISETPTISVPYVNNETGDIEYYTSPMYQVSYILAK
jgi:hypothetical protein